MYPYHRLLKMVLGNLFRKQEVFNIDKEYHFQFRPGFGDIDVYPEVNNGRHLVFCDLARYDIAFRIGLFRYVRKNKYAFVIGGSTMRYRKRLAPFRKATVRSKIVGFDEKFYYFQQTIEQKGVSIAMESNPSSQIFSVDSSRNPFQRRLSTSWRNYEGFGLQTRTVH